MNAMAVPLVRLDGGTELQVDRLVAGQQRQIPMGGRARDDLQMAAALQIGERPRNVAADAAVQLPHPLVELLPEVGERHDLLLVEASEELAALDARAPHVLAVERQLLRE